MLLPDHRNFDAGVGDADRGLGARAGGRGLYGVSAGRSGRRRDQAGIGRPARPECSSGPDATPTARPDPGCSEVTGLQPSTRRAGDAVGRRRLRISGRPGRGPDRHGLLRPGSLDDGDHVVERRPGAFRRCRTSLLRAAGTAPAAAVAVTTSPTKVNSRVWESRAPTAEGRSRRGGGLEHPVHGHVRPLAGSVHREVPQRHYVEPPAGRRRRPDARRPPSTRRRGLSGLRVRGPPGPAVSPYTEELDATTTRRTPEASAASSTAWVPANVDLPGIGQAVAPGVPAPRPGPRGGTRCRPRRTAPARSVRPKMSDLQPEPGAPAGCGQVRPLLIGAVDRVEGVEPDDGAAPPDQQVDEMGADEAGGARHHVDRVCSGGSRRRARSW